MEKQLTAIENLVLKTPKLVSLFLDSTKNQDEFNDSSFRLEMLHFTEQFPKLNQFFYELLDFLHLSKFIDIFGFYFILER